MTKTFLSIGLLSISSLAYSQMGNKFVSDTLIVQQIEDVRLHRTGNPNNAKLQTGKSQLTVMETPQSVSIVTHEIIEQQQAKQLSEVLQNVNGMYVTSSRGSSQDSFGGRGFTFGSDNIFKNGARVNSGVFPEVSGLERVEVLKGSNAMLYGNTAAGGIVNLVTKKPRFEQGGSVSLDAGSWNDYKSAADFYGPLSKNIAFRVNGSYENAESFRDVVTNKKYYFNPSFIFNLGKKTQIILEGDYLKNDFTPDFGIGSITNKDSTFKINDLLDRNAFVGANWQYQNVQQATSDIVINHQFNDKWTLNSVLSYQNYTKDYFSTERTQWAFDSNNRLTWNRPLNRTYNEQNYGSAQINLNGEFNTGTINHKILIGSDGDYGQSDSYTYFNPDNNKTFGTSYFYGTNGSANGIIYLDDPSSWASGAIPNSQKQEKNRISAKRFGAFVQDYVSLTKEFKVIAGIRWSYIENLATLNTKFKTNLKTQVANTSLSDQAFSPKVGLVYSPDENLSLFATYTNSFAINAGYTAAGLNNLDITGAAYQILDRVTNLPKTGINPTTVDQYEIGAKKNIWKNVVALNVTLYQILYHNFYQNYFYVDNAGAIQTPDTNLKEFAGKLRSRGFEIDITGNPTKNISLIGGVSYNNSVYVNTPDKGYVENQRLVRTPSTTANASVFYKFTDYVLKGFNVGVGAYFIGGRLAGNNDTKSTNITRNGVSRTFAIKDYTTVNLSAGYDWNKFSIQGKVGNLFDVINYTVHENYSVNPITPRNYYFTLTYKL